MKSDMHSGRDRRLFLQSGALIVTKTMLSGVDFLCAGENTDKPLLRIALITDVHYADKEPRINRYYRESLMKVDDFVKKCKKLKPDFAVELGDLIDSAGDVEIDLKALREANGLFHESTEERHYVLGNHCVETLKKHDFMKEVGKKDTFYSFDRNGYHFIVLDACFRKNGVPYGAKNFHWTDSTIPDEEVKWLREDLQNNSRPAIVFTHQCLDTNDHYSVFNSSEVRKILENSGRIKLVLQGHFHKGRQQTINGIYYCTLCAAVEGDEAINNAFSFLDIHGDGRLVLNGYYKQKGHMFQLH